jgi:2-dehydropantoate 2-reductase
MRALIVGAGAVGQVFGYHLARGGAQVGFLVKPRYADEARRGYTLYPLNQRGAPAVRFTDFEVLTEASACTGWDQIYITVASTALAAGTWLAELVAACPTATLVTLQPGLDDRATIAAAAGDTAERVVSGSIGFLSYHAPLPAETRFAEPGMAYWFFPLQKSPFSGAPAHVDAVVAALRAGGLPSKRVRDVGVEVAFPSAMLSAFVAALEAGDWSFRQLRADTAPLGARAAREMMAVTAHALGVRAPLGPRLAARAFVFRAVTRLAPLVMPVDFEAYMRVHFTKVGDQMHAGLHDYAARGRAASLPTPALDELARRLPA